MTLKYVVVVVVPGLPILSALFFCLNLGSEKAELGNQRGFANMSQILVQISVFSGKIS